MSTDTPLYNTVTTKFAASTLDPTFFDEVPHRMAFALAGIFFILVSLFWAVIARFAEMFPI
jgi:hypothetical protein